MLTKEIIFEDFRKLETSKQKVEYLQWLQGQKTGLDINFEKLIEYWSNQK